MLAPPDVSPARVAALRAALAQTFVDASFLADCEKQRLYAAPAPVVVRLQQIYNAGGSAN